MYPRSYQEIAQSAQRNVCRARVVAALGYGISGYSIFDGSPVWTVAAFVAASVCWGLSVEAEIIVMECKRYGRF